MWASNACRFVEPVRGRLAERDSSQIYSFEVEARNDEEAAQKAEELFNGDIYTMYVYLM